MHRMRMLLLGVLLSPTAALAIEGTVAPGEISIAGIVVGDSPGAVIRKLGEPRRKEETSDFLDLHYHYPKLQVSFSDDVVAGLYTDHPTACTPMHLCPGDRLDKMRSLYGPPVIADREQGIRYEYSAPDVFCWLEIAPDGSRIASIAVACQP